MLRPFLLPYSPKCVEGGFCEVQMAMIYTQRRTLAL